MSAVAQPPRDLALSNLVVSGRTSLNRVVARDIIAQSLTLLGNDNDPNNVVTISGTVSPDQVPAFVGTADDPFGLKPTRLSVFSNGNAFLASDSSTSATYPFVTGNLQTSGSVISGVDYGLYDTVANDGTVFPLLSSLPNQLNGQVDGSIILGYNAFKNGLTQNLYRNVVIGAGALENSVGYGNALGGNVVIGNSAAINATQSTNGGNNVIIGSNSAASLDQGYGNVVIGRGADLKNENPIYGGHNNNVVIGDSATAEDPVGNAVVIGSGASIKDGAGGSIVIGHSATTGFGATFCFGDGATATDKNQIVLGSDAKVTALPPAFAAPDAGFHIVIDGARYKIWLTADP